MQCPFNGITDKNNLYLCVINLCCQSIQCRISTTNSFPQHRHDVANSGWGVDGQIDYGY